MPLASCTGTAGRCGICDQSGDLVLHSSGAGQSLCHVRARKECLLGQNVIAGIGNIYSDEILFAAKIHPARPAKSLSKTEWEHLAAAVPERLAYFIEKNALTPEEYLESKGQDYRNTPFL